MRYIYSNKDYLGNVRLSFTKDLKVMDKNDYYPFGMSFLKTSVSLYDPMAIPYNYKFGGKELQEFGGYDFGNRTYMPDIGRWTQIDPLAETSRRFSPYLYANNNPLRFIDPDGMDEEEAEQEMDKQDDERHSQETMAEKSIDKDSGGSLTNTNASGVNSSALHQSALAALDGGDGGGGKKGKGAASSKENANTNSSSGFSLNNVKGIANGVGKVGASASLINALDKGLGGSSKVLKTFGNTGGNIAAGVEAGSNFIDYYQGNVSGGRFAYRMTGVAASWGTDALVTALLEGAAIGSEAGPAGVVAGAMVGVGFKTAEVTRDTFLPQFKESMNGFYNNLIMNIGSYH